MKSLLFSFLFPVLIVTLAGSGGRKFENSDELIQRANQLYDSGDYSSAILLLQEIPETDPNYTTACYELALNFYTLDEKDKALAKCREALFLRYEDPVIYSLIGSIMDDSGKSEEGVRIILQGLKKWPYNQNLMYNLGVNYLNTGKPDSAERILQRAITFYPYHTRSHLALAHANYAMGRIAQSYLAYSMAILLTPNSNNIGEFEKAIGGKLKINPRSYDYPYSEGTDKKYWDNLKYLLQSEFAFNKDFDYSYKPDFTFTRQSLMLFKNLRYDPSDTSLYSRLYGRLFSEIINKNWFETYINYCMNSFGHQGSQEWNKKNPGKINNFVNWAQEFIDNGRPYGYYSHYEKQQKTIHHFDENMLKSIGELSGKDNIRNGTFYIISNKGAITERGTYINDLTEGKWLVFWPDGTIRQDFDFVNDRMIDTARMYYPNGAIDLKIPLRHGKRHGEAVRYSSSGRLIQRNTFAEDLLNGPGFYYDAEGNFIREYIYVNDTAEGKTTERWLNGNLKTEYTIQNDLYEGPYRSWYRNGNLKSELFYVKGVKTGTWCDYHYNGTVSDSGAYDEKGNLTGIVKSYDEEGKLTAFSDKYTEGVFTGISVSYFDNGNERIRLQYEKDSLKQITSFDKKGKILYRATAINDSIYYKLFYDDGILAKEGPMVHGQNQGLWKTYNPLGVMIAENHYLNGLRSGLQKTWYPNGTLSEEYLSDSSNIVGIYKSYFKNGQLKTTGNYIKEGSEGEFFNYYSDGKISSRWFYIKGTRAGRNIEYYPDGHIKSEEFYNDEGKAVRTIIYDHSQKVEADWIYDYGYHEFTINYPDGKPKLITKVADNLKNGKQERYFPNGQLEFTANYIHGRPDGIVKYFDYKGSPGSVYNYVFGEPEGEGISYENGKIVYRVFYENGIRKGRQTSYYDFNGKIAREISIENEERHGFSDYYAPDGNFMYRVRYDNGTIKGYSWKNSSGNFVPEVAVNLKTKEMLTYYSNGKISARIALNKGVYHGKTVTYYSNGNIISESEYKNDEITGTHIAYYPNGKVMQVITYLHDEENGPYKSYYPNGKVMLTGNYVNELRHGDWYVYDETGRNSEVLKYHYGEIYEIVAN